MKRGRVVLKEWEQRVLAEREAVQVIARCAWCPWQLTGTVRDTREAHREHRTAEHPEHTVPARRTRHRPFRQMRSETNLDDNIANARQQGAATWEGAA